MKVHQGAVVKDDFCVMGRFRYHLTKIINSTKKLSSQIEQAKWKEKLIWLPFKEKKDV